LKHPVITEHPNNGPFFPFRNLRFQTQRTEAINQVFDILLGSFWL
jgi:hypothetical protein